MKRIGWGLLVFYILNACSTSTGKENNTNPEAVSATGQIKGLVSYQKDKNKLPDAGTTIYAVSTTTTHNTATSSDLFKNRYFQAKTDADGSYAFNNLPADTYSLIFISGNAPKKLNYYKTRFAPALEPLLNDQPLNRLDGPQAKAARLDSLFKDQQTQVKTNVQVEANVTQLLTQEFIIN